jgi:hypothetical protein
MIVFCKTNRKGEIDMQKINKNKKIKAKTKERVEVESLVIVYLIILLIVGVYIMLKAGYANALLMRLGVV